MNAITTQLQAWHDQPNHIQFTEVMALIDQHYDFTPSAFTNGEIVNEAGTNNGSCKLFALAQLYNLSDEQTLVLFGEHYRQVVANPAGNDHLNIRNFQQFGWSRVGFDRQPLQPKNG